MDKSAILTVLCLSVVLFAGCFTEDPNPVESTATHTYSSECNPPEHSDGGIPRCLLSERQPDIGFWNEDSNAHNLSIRIVRNDETVTFSKNVTVWAGSPDDPTRRTVKDVIDSPGRYRITATLDDATTATITDTFEERWHGTGGREWRVYISPSGELEFRVIQHG